MDEKKKLQRRQYIGYGFAAFAVAIVVGVIIYLVVDEVRKKPVPIARPTENMYDFATAGPTKRPIYDAAAASLPKRKAYDLASNTPYSATEGSVPPMPEDEELFGSVDSIEEANMIPADMLPFKGGTQTSVNYNNISDRSSVAGDPFEVSSSVAPPIYYRAGNGEQIYGATRSSAGPQYSQASAMSNRPQYSLPDPTYSDDDF